MLSRLKMRYKVATKARKGTTRWPHLRGQVRNPVAAFHRRYLSKTSGSVNQLTVS